MNNIATSSSDHYLVPAVQSVSAVEVLNIWERGQSQLPAEQALTMLAAACPGVERDELAALSIGRRDAALLTLREKLFGSQLSSLADCPSCGERLEMGLTVADVRAPMESRSESDLSLERPGLQIQFRLPTSHDLIALAECAGSPDVRLRLFERCVTGVRHSDGVANCEPIESHLPTEIIDEVIERIADADPQADVAVNLTCPCCGHQWRTGFDVVSYLWRELQSLAARLLREVHFLAASYGWSQSEILSMSALRRQCYLEMLAR